MSQARTRIDADLTDAEYVNWTLDDDAHTAIIMCEHDHGLVKLTMKSEHWYALLAFKANYGPHGLRKRATGARP